MSVSKTQQKREHDKDLGPHGSFPVSPAGDHLKAAWDLAGHAANPDEIRRKIIAFAHEHGLTEHLPQAAKDHMNGMSVQKAKQSDTQALFSMAWNHESMEGDTHEKRRLVAFAHEHQLQHLLPEDAHGMMHDMSVPHNHEGVKNDAESGLHSHMVVKALDPISPFTGEVVKAWEDGDVAHWEGWLSTPRKDGEKDVTEPEAFLEPAQGYFSRMAPVSLQHGLINLPVGHLQKAAIVRDGVILKSFSHPTDPADFENFPGSGTGVWVRGLANEKPGRDALRKGNVGGMSFIANAAEKEPLPGGRYRYTKLDPWIESTIAAYPINPDAVIAVVKAFGVTPEKENTSMGKLEDIFNAALAAQEAEKQVQDAQTITKAELGEALQEFKTLLLGEVSNEVKKALPVQDPDYRGEGVGRKGTIPQTADPREADPANYLIQKAEKGEEWDLTDKQIVAGLTLEALLSGLNA